MRNQNEQRWLALWRRIGAQGNAHEVYHDLVGRYSQPRRAYHTLDHVLYCLVLLDEYRFLAEDPHRTGALELALWMHDVIYRTHRCPAGLPSSEVLSAVYTDDVLAACKVDFALREKVYGLIMVTHHDRERYPAKTRDEMLMADIDWSPLGCPWKEFEQNGRNIRHEYAGYSDEEFRRGRIAFMRAATLECKQFYLPEFEARFGDQARENITKELENLRRY